MGLSAFYGTFPQQQAVSLLNEAVDCGVRMFDTADMYGEGENERLLGRVLKHRRSEMFVATKFGILTTTDDPMAKPVRGDHQYVREAVHGSLRRLGVEVIDLLYVHRIDPSVPIEETVGAMSRLVSEGKVRCLGLSEASADTIRRAHSVHAITAVQSEWSLWARDIEAAVVPMCRELGIRIVAYSPLGRGLLANRFPEGRAALTQDDYRLFEQPRFSEQNLDTNNRIAAQFAQYAHSTGMTAAQLALAWVHSRGGDVVPIPGSRSSTRMRENLATLGMSVSDEVLQTAEQIAAPQSVQGERCAPEHAGLLFG